KPFAYYPLRKLSRNHMPNLDTPSALGRTNGREARHGAFGFRTDAKDEFTEWRLAMRPVSCHAVLQQLVILASTLLGGWTHHIMTVSGVVPCLVNGSEHSALLRSQAYTITTPPTSALSSAVIIRG